MLPPNSKVHSSNPAINIPVPPVFIQTTEVGEKGTGGYSGHGRKPMVKRL